jgi:hypothetical protein
MTVARWESGLLAVLVAVQLFLAERFWFVTDDAYISFRYSKNWAAGHGVRYNLGDHTPVEGYSNFLWVAAGAVVEALGLDITWWLPALSMALASAFLITLFVACRRGLSWSPAASFAATSALAFAPGFVVWSTGGLATMAEAFLLFVVAERLVLARGDRWPIAAAAAIALALVRTEGIAWFGVTVVLAGLVAVFEPPRRKEIGLAVGKTVGVVGVLFAAYYGWRFLTYGTLVSNTAAAKVGLSWDQVERGVDYVLLFWMEALGSPVYLACVPALWRVARWRGLWVGALAFGPTAYAVLVGGDFMTMGRLLVPGLAFGALALGAAVETGWRSGRPWVFALAVCAVGLNALPLMNVQLVPEEVRANHRVRWNTRTFRTEYGQWVFMRNNARAWARFGKTMGGVSEPGDSLVLGAIGAVGYHSDLFIYDRYGLVTREVAVREVSRSVAGRSPGHDKEVSPSFFLDDEPTFLRAEFLGTRRGLKGAESELRSWRAKADIKARYAPEIRSAVVDGETLYVVVLARTDDAAAVWEEWPAPARALMLGGADEP